MKLLLVLCCVCVMLSTTLLSDVDYVCFILYLFKHCLYLYLLNGRIKKVDVLYVKLNVFIID